MFALDNKPVTLDPDRTDSPPMLVRLPDRLVATVPMQCGAEIAYCPNCRHEMRVPSCCSSMRPSHALCSPTAPPCMSQDDEVFRLKESLRVLRCSGWYYGMLDWQGARDLLKDAGVGTFLIRDSGDRNYIFTLSLQTENGSTSVRLHYQKGHFRLDCDKSLSKYMPQFRSVMELIMYYMRLGHRAIPGTMWVDRDGCPYSAVVLKAPLRKAPPPLLHCARLAIHRALANPLAPTLWCAPKHRLLPLPSTLKEYLAEYPYSI